MEDEATQLAKEVGCVACVLGDASTATNASCNIDMEVLKQYDQLYRPQLWPSVDSEDAPSPALLDDRALGSILGSCVADAAASGVHWIYDLDALAAIDAERRQQVRWHAR